MYISPALINHILGKKGFGTEQDEVRHLIDLKTSRIQDVGASVPVEKVKRNPLLQGLDYADRFRNAIVSGLHNKMYGGSFGEGAERGFSGKQHIWGSDIAEALGIQNKVGKFAAGLALDIGLDPVSYIPFGGIIGKGLRAVNAPMKAINLAEKGLISELIAKPTKEFGKGMMSHGLQGISTITKEGTHLLDADMGRGVAGALGRYVGGIGGKDKNLGKFATSVYDTIGSTFKTDFVRHGFDPRGIPDITSHAAAKQLLKQGQRDVRKIGRQAQQLFQESAESLADSPLRHLKKEYHDDLLYLSEAPIYYVRDVLNRAKNPGSVGSKYSVKEAKTAHKLLTSPLDASHNFQRDTAVLAETFRNTPLMAPEFADLQKRLTSRKNTLEIIMDAHNSVDKELVKRAGGNTFKENALRESLQYWVDRNKQVALKEGLSSADQLPVYIYHCITGTPADKKRFIAKYPEMARQLSLGIKPHKSRLLQTAQDFDNFALKLETKNKEMLYGAMKDKVSATELKALRAQNLSVDELKAFAKKSGVPVQALDFEPVVQLVKDPYVIQMMRERESARFIARKGFLDKYGPSSEVLGDTVIGHSGTLIRPLSQDRNLLKRGWVESRHVTGFPPGTAMHPELYRAVRNLDNVLTDDEAMQHILKGYQKLTNVWKFSTTSGRPGWYELTLFGNVFNGYLAGLYNMRRYVDALQVQMGQNIDSVLAKLGVKSLHADKAMTTKELWKIFKGEGLDRFGSESFADVGKTPLEMSRYFRGESAPAKTVGQWALKKGKGVVDNLRNLGGALESNSKLALFIDRLGKGDTVDQAAETVRKYLFDYSDLTKTERYIKSFIAPFYTFTRKNLPLQLESMVKQPHKFLAVMKAQQATYGAAGLSQEDIEAMPPWFKERAFAMPGGKTFFSPSLPSSTASDFLDSPLRMALNMVSPLIKTPFIEMPLNVAAFTGQPIERYEGQKADFLGIPMSAKAAYTLSQLGTGRELVKAAHLLEQGKEYKGTTSPVAFDNPIATFLSSLALPAMHYSPEKAKLYNAYDYNRRLEDVIKALKDAGVPVRTFEEIQKEKTHKQQLRRAIIGGR